MVSETKIVPAKTKNVLALGGNSGAVFFLIAALFLALRLFAADPEKWKQLPALPDRLGVAGPFAGVSGGGLIVAGGANFPDKMPWEGGQKVWTDRIWFLERPDGAWRQVGKLPRPLAYGVSVTTPEGVVCVGGSDAHQHYASVFRLVWKNNKLFIEPLPHLPISIANAGGAIADQILYIAGGSEKPGEQSALNRVFALNLMNASAAWREIKSLPGKPRILPVAAAYQNAFYIFGGVALEPNATGKVERIYLRDAWCYDEAHGWKRLSDLPKSVAAGPSPAPVINGEALLLAGDDGSRWGFQPMEKHPGWPRAILAYNLAHDRWREAGEVFAPRVTAPCVEWKNRIVIPSGEVRPGVRSPEVWAISRQVP